MNVRMLANANVSDAVRCTAVIFPLSLNVTQHYIKFHPYQLKILQENEAKRVLCVRVCFVFVCLFVFVFFFFVCLFLFFFCFVCLFVCFYSALTL